MLRLMQFKSVL